METEVTNALDALGVEYRLKPHSRAALTAETAAAERNVRVSQIVKCMVGATEAGLVVMLIPGDRKLKSSKARKYLGAQGLELVPAADLEANLGLTVGAISPLQLVGKARILMDPSVLQEEEVDISSGDPLAGVELTSESLRQVLNAELVPIISMNS